MTWMASLESQQDTTVTKLVGVVWEAWERDGSTAVGLLMHTLLREWGHVVHGLVSARLKDCGWTWQAGVWTPAPEDNLRLKDAA